MKRQSKISLSCTLALALTAGGTAWAQQAYRVEKDLLGEKQVPADAYYGVQTMRALENFQISGVPINHYPGFVEAWAIVKLAAARANTAAGAMKPERLALIGDQSERGRSSPASSPGRSMPVFCPNPNARM